MGAANLRELESEAIVALCDVDLSYAAGTIKRYPAAEVFTDYRVMLEKRKDIDAVVIATPDHTHAVITMAAMRAGKHVYTQKPLTHGVWEARQLALAAKASKVTTQMGIQGHSGEGIRLVVEWVRAGLIGEVREVDGWCDLSYYPWGHAYWSSKWGERPADIALRPGRARLGPLDRPGALPPVSPGLSPDGLALLVGFRRGHDGRPRGAHPRRRRVGPGARRAGDGRGHELRPQCRDPSAVGHRHLPVPGPRREAAGQAHLVRRARGRRGPRSSRTAGRCPPKGGSSSRATKGTIMCGVYGEGPRIIPEKLMQEAKRPEKSIPRVEGSHEQDWARASKAGRKAGAAFEYSGPLTEICLLGNVAKRLDTRIAWDPVNLRVTNAPEAEALIRRPYRPGWSL